MHLPRPFLPEHGDLFYLSYSCVAFLYSVPILFNYFSIYGYELPVTVS